MSFLRNLWRSRSPSFSQIPRIQQPGADEEDHQRARRERESQQVRQNKLSDTLCLKNQVASLERGRLADAEKIQRQQQLLLQAREDASKREEEHRHQLNKLYIKLNSLQSGQKRLTDEELRERMRRLVQNLECWVKSNFRDAAKLASSMIRTEGFPRTTPQRRAYIQAYITDMVYRRIFVPYRFGVMDNPCGQIIYQIETSVQQTCPQPILRTWKTATGIGLEPMTIDFQCAEFIRIIDRVEGQFAFGASSPAHQRKEQLWKFLQNCAAMKNDLSREPDMFGFFSSPTGVDFSDDTMTSFGGDGDSLGKVRLCLWPALYKITHPGDGPLMVIEPEMVWTMD
ncbi:hypothetical protein BDW62DRAFT_200106 [Aspergillus aurantiobrunneus]